MSQLSIDILIKLHRHFITLHNLPNKINQCVKDKNT